MSNFFNEKNPNLNPAGRLVLDNSTGPSCVGIHNFASLQKYTHGFIVSNS